MQEEHAKLGPENAGDVRGATARILDASPNFRDIGQLPAAAGHTLRPGLVYRSGALDELGAGDLAVLRSLDIRLCFDLRSEGERIGSPSRWPEGGAPRILALEVATDIRTLDRELAHWLADHPDREGASRLMHGIYRSMPLSCAPVLSRLFAELARGREVLPVVIHCTAGKDRTGFVVAMLLKALGVADADVFADYLESNKHYDRLRQDKRISALLQGMLGFALSPDALQVVTCADRSYLACAFEEIEKVFGSIDLYLEERAGLDAAKRAALQKFLLAPAAADDSARMGAAGATTSAVGRAAG